MTDTGTDDPRGSTTDDPSVRVRGIYATALTQRLLDAGHTVVQASDPIDRRFDAGFPAEPATVSVETTDDDQGVAITGAADDVPRVADSVTDVGRDALSWRDAAPKGAVFHGVVSETLGSGAVVDLGDRRGFLPYDAVDDYADEGDTFRVQVREPRAPWDDERPVLGTDLVVGDDVAELTHGASGVTADAPRERATELVRTTEILPADPPEGWALRWQRGAIDADMDTLNRALEDATRRATELLDAVDDDPAPDADPDAPRRLVAPRRTRWVWFGRECRFGLDADRRRVVSTMPGHHRIKAGSRAASAAVDFAEAVCEMDHDDPDAAFPFDVVADQFGPREGDRVAIGHGKPDGRLIILGRGEVTDYDPEGRVTLERSMSPGGSYDALGTEREAGDVAVTKLTEGKWWYPTVYRNGDGERKGTYVNVCTPVELFPDAARYVDLHVDVVKHRDGTVERVDDDELDAAVEAGEVPESLAAKARTVATAVERALSK